MKLKSKNDEKGPRYTHHINIINSKKGPIRQSALKEIR